MNGPGLSVTSVCRITTSGFGMDKRFDTSDADEIDISVEVVPGSTSGFGFDGEDNVIQSSLNVVAPWKTLLV